MKLDGEKMVAAYRERGLHYFNLRLSNVIGYPVTPRIKAWNLVANDYALQLAYSNTVIIKSEKSSTRDFLPMSDFLNAIDLLVNLKKSHKILHLMCARLVARLSRIWQVCLSSNGMN